jgi:dihydroorotate dehydrogenase (NAD+) catalytic subunit
MINHYLKPNFLNLDIEKPLVLASGILGVTASSMLRVIRFGAGAVTTKSFNMEARKGHPGPSIVPYKSGLLNAVGLSNPGAEEAVKEIQKFKAAASGVIFASIFGRTIDEFYDVAKIAVESAPHLIEVNISCPNVASEFGSPFGDNPSETAQITQLVKKAAGNIPVSMKLGPHGPGVAKMALVCEENGADAITAINTAGPGMIIDVNVKKPALSNITGGISGPAILPIAVKSVFEIYKNVKIPIIGTGGVTTAEDAIQMILAGASLVSLGTSVYYEGMEVFGKINKGILEYMKQHHFSTISEIRGLAHE